ncbi:MAG: hypothetical protein PHF21_02705 [Bacilli bacterium]|nr:hypothetical protein [Bacilli bacterium]
MNIKLGTIKIDFIKKPFIKNVVIFNNNYNKIYSTDNFYKYYHESASNQQAIELYYDIKDIPEYSYNYFDYNKFIDILMQYYPEVFV